MSGDNRKLSPAKVAYESLLELNAEWQAWIIGASEFENAIKPHMPWEKLGNWHKQVISQRLATSQPDTQLLVNSFYVTMVAGFEEYLRALIREVVSALNSSGKKASDVNPSIVKSHIKEAAGLLRRIDSPPDYMAINADDLCRSIGSCVAGSNRLEFSVDALAYIESPIKMDNFFGRLSDFGISIGWDVLGGSAQLKDALKMSGGIGSRDVGKAAKTEIERVARFRNRIAHTGGHAADVSAQVIAQDSEFLKALCWSVDSVAYPQK